MATRGDMERRAQPLFDGHSPVHVSSHPSGPLRESLGVASMLLPQSSQGSSVRSQPSCLRDTKHLLLRASMGQKGAGSRFQWPPGNNDYQQVISRQLGVAANS